MDELQLATQPNTALCKTSVKKCLTACSQQDIVVISKISLIITRLLRNDLVDKKQCVLHVRTSFTTYSVPENVQI